jgi:hypothetical protein
MKNQTQIKEKNKITSQTKQPQKRWIPIVSMDDLERHDPADIATAFEPATKAFEDLDHIMRSGDEKLIATVKNTIGLLYTAILKFGPKSEQAAVVTRHIQKVTKQLRRDNARVLKLKD